MSTFKQIVLAFLLPLYLFYPTAAQDSATAQRTSLTITASASAERVRITAPASIVQMHVEVFAAGGEKLFDQEIRGGNVFDWHLQDGQGQRLIPGSYVCVVTVKSMSGKLTQRIGTVSVEEKSVSVQPAASLSAPQAQTIGPVEDNSSWTIPTKEGPQTPTVIAHDGTDGQMIRGRGALSFRIGNFFTGSDTEQMRLTEAGNLGIGTSEPGAKLEVAGTIRAQRFLMAKPKSSAVDKTATATDTLTTDSSDFQPLIMGTGTQDRIAKWTDNAGTLGDSGITETASGFVGIGTTAPSARLVVSSNSSTLPPAAGIARFADADGVQTTVFADSFGTNPIFNVRRANGTAAAPSALQASQLIGVIGASGYGASAYSGTRARVGFFASENWTNTANGTYLTFNTTANGAATAGGTERMRIDSAGNVGIGTAVPAYKLHVVGQDVRVEANAPGIFPRFSLNFVGGGADEKRWQNYASSKALNFTSLNDTETAETFWLQVNRGTGTAISNVVLPNGNVGIGGFGPSAKLSVVAPGSTEIAGAAMSSTLRTTAGTLGTTAGDELSLASIGFLAGSGNNSSLGIRGRRITGGNSWTTTAIGLGMDVDNTVRAGDATVWLHANGNVGIGQSNPTAKLTVEGTVQSNSGGFKFPDGSVQTTAAENNTYTAFRPLTNQNQIQLPNDQSDISILHLTLPNGIYLLTTTVELGNANTDFRNIECRFSGEDAYTFRVLGNSGNTMTMHTVQVISSGGVDVQCHVDFTNNGSFSVTFANARRLTAVKTAGVVVGQ
jgi:hypothetical protein